MAEHAARPRVAVLYSGRFYGNLTNSWIENHLRYLIRPLRAAVFVVGDVENWCHAPEDARKALSERRFADANHIFQREVRSAFGNRSHVYGRLVSGYGPDASHFLSATTLKHMYGSAAAAVPIVYSNFWYQLLRRWYMQFVHYADADELRREYGSHDVVIRARLDVTFNRTCRLPPLDDGTVGALGYFGKMSYPGPPQLDLMSAECDDEGKTVHGRWAHELKKLRINESSHAHIPCQRLWRDYLYVGTQRAMTPLAEMSETTYNLSRTGRRQLLFDRTTRCFGLCAEEQTVLNYRHRGVRLAPLDWPWKFNRLAHGTRRTPAKPTSAVCTGGAGVKISR